MIEHIKMMQIADTLSWHMVNASPWTSASYKHSKSLVLESPRPCASSNTVLDLEENKSRIVVFHKLISLQDVGHMLHLNVAQHLSSL